MVSLENWIKIWGEFSNSYMNTIGFWRYSLKNKENAKLLKKNKKFKEIHKGERCFILGNGPSLNEIDFSTLKDEYVFTVNELMLHEHFSELNSNYHLFADPAFFEMDYDSNIAKERKCFFENMGEEVHKTIVFVPIEAKKNIHEIGWLDGMQLGYWSSQLYFYSGFSEKINFTKFIPGFWAVIQWAIALAVYMGFKEIYLLGCEATNAVIDVSRLLGMERDKYAFSMNDRQIQNRDKENEKWNSAECLFYGYNQIFIYFKEISHWCDMREVKLVNCSPNTLIESIPKDCFENIIKR